MACTALWASSQNAPLTNLRTQLEAVPEGGWVKVNLNLYSDVWTPADLRPLYGSSNPTPFTIINAWSGFAWDPNRGDLIIYGGGHANSPGNDVYRWHGATQLWERASLPSEVIYNPLGFHQTIDGPFNSPIAAHTYDNNSYLPIADRFLVFGGASFNTGGPYMVEDPAGSARKTGPYFFDPNRADPNKVGGLTGSHVQRVAPHPEIVGGQMWSNRDIFNRYPAASMPGSFVNGVSGYKQENGHDVVYIGGYGPGGGTDTNLFKYTVVDVNDPSKDTMEKVGTYWVTPGPAAGTYDPVRNIFLATGVDPTPFTFWDLSTAGPTNKDQRLFPTDLTGGFSMTSNYGLDYDPVRDQYLLWQGGPDVWVLKGPQTMALTGWTMQKAAAPTSATVPPALLTSGGVRGKWKYVPNLDVFIALEDANQGNVWFYKPVGWSPPAASGLPTVSLTAPAAGSSFVAPTTVTVSANASDSDGTVARVDFYAGSTLIGSDSTAPYSISWNASTAGSYSLTAVAVDNLGGSTTSSPVAVTVTGGSNAAPTVSLSAPSAGASFTAPAAITVSASASDSDGTIARVDFYAGGTLIGSDSSAPYSISWSNVAAGSYSLTAVAVDNLGASTTSSAVAVTVGTASNAAPTVSLTAPAGGTSYTAPALVTLSATAAD
ncbi:Ig-like domain-containing protein, partial [Chitinimonas sp.]|uniref:Ig-like domain-containing protein n=1 Tax=Chitinimonas sp. TaxID=1934313 RepID=UPI002F9562CA